MSSWEKGREEEQGAQGRSSSPRLRGERLALHRPWQWNGEEVKIINWTLGLGPLCSSRKPDTEAQPHFCL